MGLKERLIAQEEGNYLEEENEKEEVLNVSTDDDFVLDPNNIFDDEDKKEDTLLDEALLSNTSPDFEYIENLKIDTKSEDTNNQDEPEVCPKCGGKRRRNGNYYHLKTCEDYKINGEYPNRKQPIEDSSNEFDLEEPELEEKEDIYYPSELQNNLLSLAKRVILTDIQQTYTSKLLTAEALNKLIDAYLSDDNTSISNEHQVFGAVLDEIISSKFQEEHYGDLTVSVLEAIKADL